MVLEPVDGMARTDSLCTTVCASTSLIATWIGAQTEWVVYSHRLKIPANDVQNDVTCSLGVKLVIPCDSETGFV